MLLFLSQQSLREKPPTPKASQEGNKRTEERQAEAREGENGINVVSETSDNKVESEQASSPLLMEDSPDSTSLNATTATIATMPTVPQALPTGSSPLLPPTLFGSTAVPTAVDPRLLLFQQPQTSIQQRLLLQQLLSRQQRQPTMSDTLAALHLKRNLTIHNTAVALAAAARNQVAEEQMRQRRMLQDRAREILLGQTGSDIENAQHSAVAESDSPSLLKEATVERIVTESSEKPKSTPSCNDGSSSEFESEEDDAAYALSALIIEADRPKFTEQDEILEQSTLSDEEKASALCDIFGKYNADDHHKKKRFKKDLDRKSIDFLLYYMRLEIERMPVKKKEAFLEARAKCPEEDFSDARLEGFLRCDGMNASVSLANSGFGSTMLRTAYF